MNKLENIRPNINFKDFTFDSPTIDASRGYRDFARFDYDNLFPQRLLETVDESPMQKAILENRVNYILGAGFDKTKDNIYTPNFSESWFQIFEKAVRDFVYLGAFAIQVIQNESGNRFSFYHVPIDQVRLGKYTDKNIIEKAYLCSDWKKANRDRIIEIKMWGSEQPKKGERYLMYFKPYKPTEYYYAIPYWFAGINYVMADGALSQYFNNYIRNSFSSNLVIKFGNEPDEEKKQELYQNLQASFGGAENAGNIMVLFGESGILPEISSVDPSTQQADLYNTITDTVKLALVSANRLTSPVLAGISTSTGFSSKSEELIAAEVMYRLTVINQERQFLLNKFNDLLQMNGLPRVLTIQDYNLQEEFLGNVEENTDKLNSGAGASDTEAQVTDDANAENNVETKKEGV